MLGSIAKSVRLQKYTTRIKTCIENDVTTLCLGESEPEQEVNYLGGMEKVLRSKPSQAKVLTEGGDLRGAQVDVPPSGSHSCV